MNVWKQPTELSNVLNDDLYELLHLGIGIGRLKEFGIAQLDGVNVVGAALGIDDQHASSGVAFGLRCEESGGQLPLAGAAQGIGLDRKSVV